MKNAISVLFLIAALSIAPSTVNAQCTADEVEAIIDCSYDASLAECLGQGEYDGEYEGEDGGEATESECTIEDINNAIAAEVILDQITVSCCAKKGKEAIKGCLNAAISAVAPKDTKTLKVKVRILSAALRSKLVPEIRSMMETVKRTGLCEQEDEEEVTEE